MGSAIIVPAAAKGFASVQRGLGIDSYDLHELYGPDTAVWRSKVLDLGPVKYGPPNKSYWFDRSRYNNHGTITGAVWKQEPSGLWVLDFDGSDDYVDFGTALNPHLNGITAATWMAWFKVTGATGTNRGLAVRSDGLDPPKRDGLLLPTDNKVYLVVADGNNSGATGPVVTPNVWHCIVASFNGALAEANRIEMMYDGQLAAYTLFGTLPTALTTITDKFLAASEWFAGVPARFFNGSEPLTGVVTQALPLSAKQQFYYNTRHLFGV